MAYLEFNALSTVLCSSFSAKIFLPEMDKLLLDDERHEKNILFYGFYTMKEAQPWILQPCR